MSLKLNLSNRVPVVTDEMLMGHKHIKKLNISKDIIKLPVGAFHQAEKLVKVYFEPGSKLAKITESCFKGCLKLSQITHLPDQLVSIEDFAFKDCISLKELHLPGTVTYIAETAFDGWTNKQVIYCEKEFKLSNKCDATVVATTLLDESNQEHKDDDHGRRYFIVTAKCGHVGRDHYIPIDFPLEAENAKDAARLVRDFPRVKKHHPDAILRVLQVSQTEYSDQLKINNQDPYLKINSKYQQKEIESELKTRKIKDPRYQKPVNKKKTTKYHREGKSEEYIKALGTQCKNQTITINR